MALQLRRLRRTTEVTQGNNPALEFQREWDKLCREVEAIDARVEALELAIAVIQARLAAAAIP